MNLYLDIQKADQRIASGIASTDTMDGQPGMMDGTPYIGDVIDPQAIKGALADYLEYANVREMHANSAVGTAIKAELKDNQLWLSVKVVDDSAWAKVKAGVYKGFSIGGRIVKAVLEKLPDGRYIRRILELVLTEISLVDRPANPDARILLFKREASMADEPQDTPTPAPALDADTIAAIKKLAGQTQPLAKAASDPAKIVGLIQQARNELELAGDMEGASLMTQAIALIQQATGEAEAATEEPPAEPPMDMAAEGADGVAASAKTGNLAKAGGRIRTASRVGGVEALAKSLLQLAATMGSAWATKLIKMAEAEPQDMAQAIGVEFTKAVNPLASAILNVNERLTKIEAQPAPGGPVIRQPMGKLIAGQAQSAGSKPAMTHLVREQLNNLQRMARTASNPTIAKQYDDQYALIKNQYSE